MRWQKRGQAGSTAPGETAWVPSRLHPQMRLSYVCVPLNPATFLSPVLGAIAALWLADWRPGSLWTACVPWACPRQQRVPPPPPPRLSVRQASVCLPGTSWMLPLSRRQRRYSAAATMPSRNTAADMMLQPVGGTPSERSRCAVRQAFRSLQIVPMAGEHQENNRLSWADINQSIINQHPHSLTAI